MLWTPDAQPPQVDPEAVDDIIMRVENIGIETVVARTWSELTDRTLIPDHLDRLGKDKVASGLLKAGAALGLLAYRETGYYQDLDDDQFGIDEVLAEVQGIPESYFLSLLEDTGLSKLLGAVQLGEEVMGDAIDLVGVTELRKYADMGAGCVRYYLHGAVAA